jgi:hypothetical protein
MMKKEQWVKVGIFLAVMMVIAGAGQLVRLAPVGNENLDIAGHASVAGNLNVLGSKNFRIDHPLDPGNRYLIHFASEGPEPFNVYAGRTRLGSDGAGWVDLPEWFEAINVDFRYQLTAIGQPAPGLHIAREIKANRFQIGGGHQGLEVSWEVRARRNDQTMRRLDPVAEIDKPIHLRGTFLDPLAWEQPDNGSRP